MPWLLDMYQLGKNMHYISVCMCVKIDYFAVYLPHFFCFSAGPKDVVIFNNTVNFDAHVIQVLPPLSTGASIVIVKPKGHLDAGHIVDLVLEHTVTSFVVTVPTLAREYMAEFKSRNLPQYKPMRAWALGGDAMPAELVHQMQEVSCNTSIKCWLSVFTNLSQQLETFSLSFLLSLQFFPNLISINCYGPTEVTVVTVEHLVPKGFETVVIGRPDANVLAVVVDSALQPLPVGVPGELLLSGPRLAMGYVGRPDLTEEKFIPNPCLDLVAGKLHPALAPYYKKAYRTGDLVRWRSDGTMDFLGRIDRQVKITGVRIELGEVESALEGAPGVEQAQATALPDPQGQKRLVGYVTPASADPMLVLAHCRAQLVPAMVPSVVVALESFPLLPNGKVDTKGLPAPEWVGAASEEYVPPSNDAESAVQKVFADVLGRPAAELSVLSDFFAAGGTSMQVFRAAALLQNALQIASVPPTLIHTSRTARAVAAELLLLKEEGEAGGLIISAITRRTWPGLERPLSSNQEQMWLLSSLGSGTAYNMPLAIDLTSTPAVETLQAALDSVAARHEVLRTRFLRKPDGTLIGLVTPVESFHVPLQVIQVTSDKEIEMVVAAEGDLAFDLEADPLLRAKLLERRRGGGAVLALTMHHAVGDAWSLGVFWKEVSEAYAEAARGATPTWQPLPIQYADYAAWQEDQLSGESGASLRAYWKQQLSGVPSVVQLPYDHPRPSQPTFAAGSLHVALPPKLLPGVEDVARQLRVNVQAVLLAALQTVLLRYSGQDDLVIGVPVAGRDRSETHGLVGYFINTLPIRCLANEDASFADMIGDASSSMLDALDHSLLPLENIVAVSGVGRVQNVNPLFQVLLQYLPDPPTDWGLKLDGIRVQTSGLLPGLEQAKMDLNINFKAEAVEAEYLNELFDASTIQRLVHSYIAILQHIVSNVDATALKAGLLGEHDVDEVVRFSVGDQRPEYLTAPLMHESFEAAAAKSPSAKCLCFEGTWLSYGEVEARASAAATQLAALGVGPGVVVGLMLDRSFELLVSMLAVLKAGGCYLPCDPEYPDDRLQIYLEDGKAKVVLTQTQYTDRAGSMVPPSVQIIDVNSAAWQNGSCGKAALKRAGPDDPAYIIFTSGSTGRPKGVQVLHCGLRDLMPWLLDMYQLGKVYLA